MLGVGLRAEALEALAFRTPSIATQERSGFRGLKFGLASGLQRVQSTET